MPIKNTMMHCTPRPRRTCRHRVMHHLASEKHSSLVAPLAGKAAKTAMEFAKKEIESTIHTKLMRCCTHTS